MRFPASLIILPALAAAVAGMPTLAQAPALPSPLAYADLVDLAIAGPVVAGVEIRRVQRLKAEEAVGLSPTKARFLVEADVVTLIRGSGGLPPRISYLVDVPLDARGRPPRLKRMRALVFAQAVPGKPAELRLAAPWAQLDWTADTEARARATVTELLSPSAPPRITGVGNAFHVPGSLPGESETQIFLTTADSRPVSLSVLRRPGEQPQWAVALGELVDEAAGPPQPGTLLWYRLACALPPALPDRSVASLEGAAAQAAREDYRTVIAGLGSCGRRDPA